MSKLHYFAYGSNLHPLRLRERVPSATVIGVVEARSRTLAFCKRSEDLSGKCNLYETGSQEDVVFGVLYEMDIRDKANLDRAESKGRGYNERIVSFTLNGKSYASFTYVADSNYVDESLLPYDWYKQFVIEGARYHSMSKEYIAWLDSFTSVADPDNERNSENLARLAGMIELNRGMYSENG
jgi:gamma-glutamylcyclotransferase